MISELARKMLALDEDLRKCESNLRHMALVIQTEYERKELLIAKMKKIQDAVKGVL